MIKLMSLLVVTAIFASGCSRTFVVTNVENLETNHSKVIGYTDQGIDVKSTNNWTIGKTNGIDSNIYLDNKPSTNTDSSNIQEPNLVVNFPFNSTALYPESIINLTSLSGDLDRVNSIDLIGFTDNVGNKYTNLVLSNKRALAVKEFILEFKKLPIETLGKGLSLPIADNDTEEGRRLNRRVEVYINE